MPRIPELCNRITRRYKPILVVGFLLTAVGGYLTSKLSLESDLAALLPDSFESVQAVERMREEVGGADQLRIALRTADFQAATELADTLARRLVASERVSSVDHENDVAFYESHALLFLDTASLDSLHNEVQRTIDAEKQRANPFMVDDLFADPEAEEAEDEGGLSGWEERYASELPDRYYTNDDSTVLVLNVYPAGSSSDLSFARSMLDDVQRIMDEVGPERFAPDMEVHYGSNIKNRVDEFEAIQDDIVGTAAYGIGGVFLLLVLFFRSLVVPLLLSVSLLSALSWTFGLTYLLVGQLNTITGFLFVVLFGMGIDYGIHAIARYLESREAGLDTAGAIHRMVCRTGAALGTTALTTSAAFFSLMLLDFRGFSELGLITGIGMLFTYAAMVVFLPAMVVLLERLGVLSIDSVPDKALTSERRPFRFARSILVGAAALTLVSAYLFTRVDFQYDFTDLRIVTEERERFGEMTAGVFSGSESPAVVLADTEEEVQEVVAAVQERMRADTASPTIASVRSIFDLVPRSQERKLEQIRRTRALVEENADAVSGEREEQLQRLRDFLAVDRTFDWQDFPENDRRRFVTREGAPGNFVFIYPSVALRDGRNAIAFRDDVGTITTASGEAFHAASSNIIVAEMLSMMTTEGPLAVALSLGVVFLILLVDFRRFRSALLVVAPLAVGIVWMGGAMYVFGMKLNFFNVVAFPSVVGIGVDHGVHIYHRYVEEGPDSLYFILRRTGVAIGMTTITTIVGYSGLMLASHPGLRSIGLLAAIGLSTTFLTAVVVLPALLDAVEADDPDVEGILR